MQVVSWATVLKNAASLVGARSSPVDGVIQPHEPPRTRLELNQTKRRSPWQGQDRRPRLLPSRPPSTPTDRISSQWVAYFEANTCCDIVVAIALDGNPIRNRRAPRRQQPRSRRRDCRSRHFNLPRTMPDRPAPSTAIELQWDAVTDCHTPYTLLQRKTRGTLLQSML